MRALVTGGSGFIGSHVVDKLLAEGIDVRIFDRVQSPFHEIDNNRIQFHQGKLTDLEDVQAALQNTDIVFHLAAVANVNDVTDFPYRSELVNVRGTMNVLEAIRRGHKIRRIVYASTVWVYSLSEFENVKESTCIDNFDHFYTVTKYAGELYCKSYSAMYDVPYTILRYGIPYGPHARPEAVIPIFVNKAFAGEPLTIAGEGQQWRKFVYVEDLADATVLAGLSGQAEGQTYNLEGREKVTIKGIVDTLAEVLDRTPLPDITVEKIENRAGDFQGKEISCKKVKEELGWEPTTSFKRGLVEYIKWAKGEEMEQRGIRVL